MPRLSALAALFLAFADPPSGDWPAYGNDPGGQRFSPLKQISRDNVAKLKIAWTHRTGDAYTPPREPKRGVLNGEIPTVLFLRE
jgi:glucose dehydrogenase